MVRGTVAREREARTAVDAWEGPVDLGDAVALDQRVLLEVESAGFRHTRREKPHRHVGLLGDATDLCRRQVSTEEHAPAGGPSSIAVENGCDAREQRAVLGAQQAFAAAARLQRRAPWKAGDEGWGRRWIERAGGRRARRRCK